MEHLRRLLFSEPYQQGGLLMSLLPYLVLLAVVGGATALLTSKKLAEKSIAAGILPRTFLGIVPALRSITQAFGVILIGAGAITIAIESGWLDARTFSRYSLPVCLMALGATLLFANRKP